MVYRTDAQVKQRPQLRSVPLADVLPPRCGVGHITMSPGQWDELLAEAYQTGWVLLELDAQEQPVAAYCRSDAARPSSDHGGPKT